MALCTGSLCLWYLYTQEEIPANSRFFAPTRGAVQGCSWVQAMGPSVLQVAFPQEERRSTGLVWEGSLGRKRADVFPGHRLK